MEWPSGFLRIPDEPWVDQPLGELALKYDTVENHGWYTNLVRTVQQVQEALPPGGTLLDYSGGTGILTDRLLGAEGNRPGRVLIVDSSPKFLRVAIEKFRNLEGVAFRRIRYLKDEKRLQTLQECVEESLSDQGVDGVVSTNAIHLYYQLESTLRSWWTALKPGGRVFIQSGNIDNPARRDDEWIIDNTVHALHERAVELVEGGAFPQYQDVTADIARMAEYEKLRAKYFLPVRPLDHYLGSLVGAGFVQLSHETRRVEASVEEWFEFLSAYHEGVLGWLGGVARIEGKEPTPEAVEDRLALMRMALEALFDGAPRFACSWTYIQAEKPVTV